MFIITIECVFKEEGGEQMKVDKKKFILIRARRCMILADLRAAGLTDGNINAIYNQRSMLPETIGKIAKALDVDITEILADE